MIKLHLILVLFQIIVILVLLYYDEPMANYLYQHKGRSKEEDPIQRVNTDAVILFTKMKSGSSIVGSIFNKQKGITYLYEPLYPFSETPCQSLLDQRLAVLHAISSCQFEKIGPLYQDTHRPDNIAKCKKYNFCFAEGKSSNFSEFLSRDAKICTFHSKKGHICPTPIKAERLNTHCKSSSLKAMKVIYLCKLKWLMPLVTHSFHNIKIIHLVRDPRATVFSRVGRKWRIKVLLRRAAAQLCGNLVENVKYADDEIIGSDLNDRFMRMRFEDFVFNPVRKTKEIYDFVGINITDDVLRWLQERVALPKEYGLSGQYPYSRLRRPDALSSWRKRLPFEHMQEIQSLCKPVFDWLGYKIYDNESEYRRISRLYFVPELEKQIDLKRINLFTV